MWGFPGVGVSGVVQRTLSVTSAPASKRAHPCARAGPFSGSTSAISIDPSVAIWGFIEGLMT